ncbi:MAG: acyl-CoA-binding protein [Anaerolineae bacterium]|nr:MAG: acyl-CoA-binding protein [Anaerolineae bacterium]
MESLQAQFEAAAAAAMNLPNRPDNETMLKLYALYKQGKVGDASGNRPGMFDMVGRAKYDAWAALRGMSPESAMQAYIEWSIDVWGAPV